MHPSLELHTQSLTLVLTYSLSLLTLQFGQNKLHQVESPQHKKCLSFQQQSYINYLSELGSIMVFLQCLPIHSLWPTLLNYFQDDELSSLLKVNHKPTILIEDPWPTNPRCLSSEAAALSPLSVTFCHLQTYMLSFEPIITANAVPKWATVHC